MSNELTYGVGSRAVMEDVANSASVCFYLSPMSGHMQAKLGPLTHIMSVLFMKPKAGFPGLASATRITHVLHVQMELGVGKP